MPLKQQIVSVCVILCHYGGIINGTINDRINGVINIRNSSVPYLKYKRLISSLGIDKLARRARTQIPADKTRILYFKQRTETTQKKYHMKR